MKRHLAASFLFVSLVAALPAVACNVPVYRYALERWPADAFEAAFFHKGPLTEDDQKLIDALQPTEGQLPNIQVVATDINDPMGQYAQSVWEAQGNPSLPHLVVDFPYIDEIPESLLTGSLDIEDAKALLDSPARREIARRVLQGESAVWVLLESGNEAEDAAAELLLQRELEKLEKTLKIPEQDPTDPANDLASPVPLKVDFSVLRINPDDPAERYFVPMMRKGSGLPAEELEGPVAFPIFGRGRLLAGLGKTLLTEENIAMACAFLTGACSCEVKSLNPGTDMLMSVNWDDLITGTAVVDAALPPLTGLGVMAESAAVMSEENKAMEASSETEAATEQAPDTVAAASPTPSEAVETEGRGSLTRNILIVIAGGSVIVIGGGFLLSRKLGG